MTPLIVSLIQEAAATAGLDPTFVGAIVRVESNGNPYAWKPEPRYQWVWDVAKNKPFRELWGDEVSSISAPPDFPSLMGSRDQEWSGQRSSWGLCQVMGAVAREEGFTGPYLTELVDPAANLTVGCRHLRGLVAWAGKNNLTKAAAAYNAGKGNETSSVAQAYARQVLGAMAAIVAHGL